MKNTLKLTLIAFALMIVCGNYASAQKFGYINSEEVMMAMPEMDSVKTKLEALQKDLSAQYEAMRVEYNNKVHDYQKAASTMSDAIRQVKEKELQNVSASIQQFEEEAGNILQEERYKLMAPVAEKAQNAITKVAKAQGMTAVFDNASRALVYHNESEMKNMLPLVKAELGIK